MENYHDQGLVRGGNRAACLEGYQGLVRDGHRTACSEDYHRGLRNGDRAARLEDYHQGLRDGDRAACSDYHHQGLVRDGKYVGRFENYHHQGLVCSGDRVGCYEGQLQQNHQQRDNIKWKRERGGKSGRRKHRRDNQYILPAVPPSELLVVPPTVLQEVSPTDLSLPTDLLQERPPTVLQTRWTAVAERLTQPPPLSDSSDKSDGEIVEAMRRALRERKTREHERRWQEQRTGKTVGGSSSVEGPSNKAINASPSNEPNNALEDVVINNNDAASMMRAPPSVDYDVAARLALIVEADAGVARAKARA